MFGIVYDRLIGPMDAAAQQRIKSPTVLRRSAFDLVELLGSASEELAEPTRFSQVRANLQPGSSSRSPNLC